MIPTALQQLLWLR